MEGPRNKKISSKRNSFACINPLNLLSSRDIFGSEFSFEIKGRDTYKTIFGAMLSIVWYIFIIFSMVYLILILSDNTNPDSSVSQSYSTENPILDMFKNDHVTGYSILVSNQTGTYFKPVQEFLRYVTPVNKIIEYETPENPEQSEVLFQEKSTKLIPNIECYKDPENVIFSNIRGDEGSIRYMNTFTQCMLINDPSEIYIQGNPSQNKYRIFEFYIYPCSLEVSECAPAVDMFSTTIAMLTVNTIIELSKKENPLSIQGNLDVNFLINPSLTIYSINSYSSNKILDDDRDFMEPRINKQFVTKEKYEEYQQFRNFQIHCTKDQIENGQCQPYIVIRMKASPIETTYLRVYPKYFEQLSELGGFAGTVALLLELLYFIYNDYFSGKYIRKQLLEYDDKIIRNLFVDDDNKEEHITLDETLDDLVQDSQDAIVIIQKLKFLVCLENTLHTKEQLFLIPFLSVYLESLNKGEKDGDKNIEKFQQKMDPKRSSLLAQRYSQSIIKNSEKINSSFNKLCSDNSQHKSDSFKKIIDSYIMKNIPIQKTSNKNYSINPRLPDHPEQVLEKQDTASTVSKLIIRKRSKVGKSGFKNKAKQKILRFKKK